MPAPQSLHQRQVALNSLPDDLLAHVLRFASAAHRRDTHPTPPVALRHWRLAAVSTAFRRTYLSTLTSLSLDNPSAKRLALLSWAPLTPCTSIRHVNITPQSKLSDADVLSLFRFLTRIGAQLKKVHISLSHRLTNRVLTALTDCFAHSIVDLHVHVPWVRRVRRRTSPPTHSPFFLPHLPDHDHPTPHSTPHNSPPASPPPLPAPANPAQPPPSPPPELMLSPQLMLAQHAQPIPQPSTPPEQPPLSPHLFEADFFPSPQPLHPSPPHPHHPFDQPLGLPTSPPPAPHPLDIVQAHTLPEDDHNLLLPMWHPDELPIDPFEPQPQSPPQPAAPPSPPLQHPPQPFDPVAALAASAAPIAPTSPPAPSAPPALIAPADHAQQPAHAAHPPPSPDDNVDAHSMSQPPTPIEQAIQDLGAFLQQQNGLLNGHNPFLPAAEDPHEMMLQLIQNFNHMQDGGAWNGQQGADEHPDAHADDGDDEGADEQPDENNAPLEPNYHPALLQDHLSHRSALTDEVLVTAVTRMPNLRCLNLDRALYITDVSAFALRNLTMLESLRLSNNHYVTDLPLKHVLANLPNLRQLRLLDMLFIGNGSMDALCSFKKRSKLKLLQLSQVGRVTDEAVKKLVNSCQALETVHIADCPKISCEAASHLSCSQSLEQIHFKPVARYPITNRTTVHLSCASSRLRSLTLVGCRNITLDGIVALGNLPGLRRLHLVGLGPVSQDVMRALGTFPKLDDILLQGDMHLTDLGVKVLCGRRGHRFLHLALKDQTENLTYDGLDSIVTWCTSLRTLEVHGMFKSDAVDRVRDCIPYANITVAYNGGMKSYVEGRGGIWDPVLQPFDDG